MMFWSDLNVSWEFILDIWSFVSVDWWSFSLFPCLVSWNSKLGRFAPIFGRFHALVHYCKVVIISGQNLGVSCELWIKDMRIKHFLLLSKSMIFNIRVKHQTILSVIDISYRMIRWMGEIKMETSMNLIVLQTSWIIKDFLHIFAIIINNFITFWVFNFHYFLRYHQIRRFEELELLSNVFHCFRIISVYFLWYIIIMHKSHSITFMMFI